MKVIYITIASENYIQYIKTLAYSLGLLGRQEILWVKLGYKIHQILLVRGDDITHIGSFEFSINELDSFLELATRIRATAIKKVIELFSPELVIYVDPDVYVYKLFEDVFTNSNMYITPHLIEDDYELSDKKADLLKFSKNLLRYGSYNMGIYGIKNSSLGLKILDFYESLLIHHCSSSSLYGFVDQKWTDLLVSIFPENIKVVKNPGLNLAYWNIKYRPINIVNDSYCINGDESLYAIHFSGVSPHKISHPYNESILFTKLTKDYQDLLLNFSPLGFESSSNKLKNSIISDLISIFKKNRIQELFLSKIKIFLIKFLTKLEKD